MRRFIAWTLTLAVGLLAAKSASAQTNVPATKKASTPAPAVGKSAAPVRGQTQSPMDPQAVKARQEADLKAKQEMDALLDAWEAHSKQITSLDVSFDRIDSSKAWGTQYYEGRAMLKSPDLACLEFTKIKVGKDGRPIVAMDKNGKKVWVKESTPDERIVCNGKEVLQYEFDEKVVYLYPLDKEVRQKALQQGPLPFLFNMKAADVKKRYGMKMIEVTDTDYVIGITPFEDIDRQSFSTAFIALNKKTFHPSRLFLYPSQGDKESQDFRFSDPDAAWAHRKVMENREMKEGLFRPVLNMEGWKVIRNPGEQKQAGQDNPDRHVPPPQKRQAAQPSMRPQGR